MRAVLTTFGSNGDVQPMVALACELRRAGHQAVLALSPNFEKRARDNAIEFVPLGPEMPLEKIRGIIAAQMGNQKPAEQVRHFLEATLPHFPGMCQVLHETCRNADVLVGSPYQFAGSVVRETTSIPYVSLHLSQFADLGGKEMREVSAGLINPYRIQQGLSPVEDPLGADGNSNQLAIYAVSRHFLQRPARWPDHYKVVGFFFHDEEDWRPNHELEQFLANGDRPLVMTFGSIVHSDPAAMTELVLEATAQAGCRAIIQQGWGGLGKQDVPDNIYVAGFAPHSWLFPRASLIVHHGGAGTTASTLRAGIPSVVVPHTLDQPIWAEFARTKGCTKNVIPFVHLNARRLGAAIRGALATPALFQAAAAFGEEIRAESGVQTARKLIEELVAGRQRPVEVSGVIKPEKVKQAQPPALVPVPRQGEAPEMPLSFAQQRLWFADQLEPGSAAFNMPFLWRFEGEMHRTGLQHVMDEMVRRHEILRTTFPMRGGRPVQRIAPDIGLVLNEVDLQGLSPEERELEIRRMATQETTWRFDLAQGPLWRMTWLRLDENSHALLGNLHHIVCDGWSQGIMSQEIGQLYEAYLRNQSLALPQASIQYADYAVWQREWLSGENLEGQLAYWRTQLAGVPVLDLPTDHPRPAIRSHHGGHAKHQLASELTEKLKALSRREGATLFMIALAAFQVLLSKYSGHEDIPVGTPIAGRTRKELEGVLGCFINMLTLRTKLNGNPSFTEVIRRARLTAVEAYQRQDVPFEKIVQELHIERDVSRTPLFQVMLAFQNMQLVHPRLHGLRFTDWVDLSEAAPFDITLEMIESQGFHCRLSYGRDVYTPETASRVLLHLDRVLQSMVTTPELSIAEFSLLSPDELHQVMVEWNGATRAYSHEYCVHEIFEQHVDKNPTAVAVEYDGESFTYSELNSRANRMARYLTRMGVGPETPVALYLERRLEFMVAVLGVLKAGGAYVPLDPALPKERLKWMVNDIDPPVVLTQIEISEKLETRGHVVCVDDPGIQEQLATGPSTNLGRRALVSNAVYIIYTSGSTGRPKAVVAIHTALVNFAKFQQKTFGVTPQDRVLQFLAPTFDPAIGDWATTLLAGATLILSPDPRKMLGPDLVQLLEDKRVTYAGLSPSILTSMPEVELRRLRILLTGGAPCPRDLVVRWSKGRQMFNVYGPTETTICVSLTQLSELDGSDPIGKPFDNVQVYVLDQGMKPVPAGMKGELYIGGVGVSRGYWKRPDLTADRFVPNIFSKTGGERLYRSGDIVRWRADGNLEFVGRADEQVKIREQRIELGEIDAVLRQQEGLRDVLVMAREDEQGEKRLVAYIVPEEMGRKDLLPGELRAALREELPAYMVPAHFVVMSAFPINASGKIDRRELPVPAGPKINLGPVVTDGLTEIEQKIAGVWSDVLRVEKVGVHDNFFDLGGDSFQSIRVQTELMKVLGREIKVLELFRFPTVRALAEYLAQQTPSPAAVNGPSPVSLDAGKERLKKQLAQRTAAKARSASATAPVS